MLPAGQATPPSFLSHYSHTVSKAHKADFYISGEGDGEYIGRVNSVEEVRIRVLLVGPDRPAVRITSKPRKETRLDTSILPHLNINGSSMSMVVPSPGWPTRPVVTFWVKAHLLTYSRTGETNTWKASWKN